MTIQEVLRKLRVDYLESGHHHCRPGWLQVKHCPFCGSNNYHLGYNLQSKFFTCWKCRGHHVIPTLIKLGAAHDLARQFFGGLDVVRGKVKQRERAQKLVEPKHVERMLPPHRKYLRERGFDPDEIEVLWNVKGIGISSKLKWRLYIPIYQDGEQVSWTTRSIAPQANLRYISASAEQEVVNHKHVVYGLDMCQQSVVIVEGPTDAWAIGPGAGALFGTAFTLEQVEQLAQFPYRYVCFDSSPDAQRNARELASQLSVFPGHTSNIELDEKDPAKLSQSELVELRRACGLL